MLTAIWKVKWTRFNGVPEMGESMRKKLSQLGKTKRYRNEAEMSFSEDTCLCHFCF